MTTDTAATTVSRTERLTAIKDVLSSASVGSHATLAHELHRRGIDVTQATLSRDLTHLGAVRMRAHDGLRYVIPDLSAMPLIRDRVSRYIAEVIDAGALAVIRVEDGSARLVADTLMGDDTLSTVIAGVIADDETVFAAPRAPHTGTDLTTILTRRFAEHRNGVERPE